MIVQRFAVFLLSLATIIAIVVVSVDLLSNKSNRSSTLGQTPQSAENTARNSEELEEAGALLATPLARENPGRQQAREQGDVIAEDLRQVEAFVEDSDQSADAVLAKIIETRAVKLQPIVPLSAVVAAAQIEKIRYLEQDYSQVTIEDMQRVRAQLKERCKLQQKAAFVDAWRAGAFVRLPTLPGELEAGSSLQGPLPGVGAILKQANFDNEAREWVLVYLDYESHRQLYDDYWELHWLQSRIR